MCKYSHSSYFPSAFLFESSSHARHRLTPPPTLSEASRKHAKQNEARDASMRDAKKRKFAAIGLKDKRRKLGGGGSAGGGGRDADD